MSDYWMDLEPPNHRQRWAGYVPTAKDEAHALGTCVAMALQAEENEEYVQRCIAGEKVFYYDWPEGLIPGHIYSETGMDEFGISRSCEYHFDLWTKEPEDG